MSAEELIRAFHRVLCALHGHTPPRFSRAMEFGRRVGVCPSCGTIVTLNDGRWYSS